MKRIIVINCVLVFFVGCISLTHVGTGMEYSRKSCSCNEQSTYILFPGDKIHLSCFKKNDVLPTYTLHVNDKISIRYPSLSEYNVEQMVKPDGTINVPRLSSLNVAGLTVNQITEELQRLYKKIDWQPEFFIVISDFDVISLDVQSVFMNSTDKSPSTVSVRPDGYANFPLIGALPVAGQKMDTIETIIKQKYSALYPRLNFEVSLDKMTYNKAFIFGHVAHPGSYEIGQTQLIPELVAFAGGYLPSASASNVVVLNVENDTVKCHQVNCNINKLYDRPISDLLVCPGMIVYVPSSRLNTLSEITKAVSNLLFFKGFGIGLQWDATNKINDLSN